MSKTRFILKIKKNQTRQVTWQRYISAVRSGVMFVLPPEIVASEPAYAYATGLINTNRYGFRAPPPLLEGSGTFEPGL
jgi:cellobiose-specific phosphotransferase system component IIC